MEPTLGSLEPSDDEEVLEGGERRQQSCFGPVAPSSTLRASPGSPGTTARLGLHFSGGPGAGNSPLSWRDGRFSDWTVQVGEKSYRLHAFLLARASLFFESHMSIAARAEAEDGVPATRGSDLTEVLPQSCHAAFEDTLDFIYSENQSAFEAPASKALLLLKIADILGIGGLFEAMGRRIEAAFSETAPLLLEQYCRFHIPGTDDGAALRQIREGAVELIVRKFQPFLAIPEMRTAMMRLPANVLIEILEADDLLVASEDIVFDFVAARLEATCQGAEGSIDVGPPENAVVAQADSAPVPELCGEHDVLWQRVRWQHLSAVKFAQALTLGQRLLRPDVSLHALATRLAQIDVGGNEAFATLGPHMAPVPPRRPILPPGVPPPTSTEIDFCFHYARSDQFACGEALRSQPKRIGDVVLRVLVFPSGTDTGVARGSLSVFLEAVPQPHWPRDWEFANIRYAISCIRWPTGSGETWAAKRKSDLWTFKANRLDRGWHDFLAPGEIHRYLGQDGFVCIRGALEPECLGRAFLLNSQAVHSGYAGPGGEAAGSSASRRSWAPRAPVGTPLPE
mmetsp:Transcript_39011/g.64271  ORF Transcript_39011/g.64271 Transcript_39011/m.64271 type:complete len:567 (+) Transcript_39011:42-1742(+)